MDTKLHFFFDILGYPPIGRWVFHEKTPPLIFGWHAYRISPQGKRVKCNHFEYATTKTCNLQRHIERKHEGLVFTCDQCDYTATDKKTVKTHFQSVHEGVNYQCNQCDFKTAAQLSPTTH